MPIEPDDLVDEVTRSHPMTIRVFLDFKMGCLRGAAEEAE
jgi:hypothetical protein